jgi:methionine-gamma-lyase
LSGIPSSSLSVSIKSAFPSLSESFNPSTSSEIPLVEQEAMGLTNSLVRFSIGLDNDIERTYQMIKKCMQELHIL